MSDPVFIVLRHELASNAVASIKSIYPTQISDVQAVTDGDGAKLKTINWGAYTPRASMMTAGYLRQWSHQEIELELRASVDYLDRSLDARYLLLLQVFEDFCARTDLQEQLTNGNCIVQSPPTYDDIEEAIENGRYVTTYRLRVSARGPAVTEEGD